MLEVFCLRGFVFKKLNWSTLFDVVSFYVEFFWLLLGFGCLLIVRCTLVLELDIGGCRVLFCSLMMFQGLC